MVAITVAIMPSAMQEMNFDHSWESRNSRDMQTMMMAMRPMQAVATDTGFPVISFRPFLCPFSFGGSCLSGFDERVSVFPVEVAEPETVCGEPAARRRLPFILILTVYVFDSFGVGVGVGASQVDEPLGGVRSHPDAVTGAGIDDEKRVVCVAPVYGDRLDGDGFISMDVKCGEHFFSFQVFRFA